MEQESLVVRSHVARDLMQSAALFKSDKTVVWEYVSNGLQYVDIGISPVVTVKLDNRGKSISIKDNGRGMDWGDLSNFFVMHGENVDRRIGKKGRGRFGTGKSAAFGIANVLRVSSTKDGKRNTVELARRDIESMSSESPIPVRTIERDVATSVDNGTLIEIEDVKLKKLDQIGVIRYVEKHLARWRRDSMVIVNHHECEYQAPPISRSASFLPDEETEKSIGSVELSIHVSKIPLDEDVRGVSVYSNQVWLESTLAGCEGRELSNYLFGEIEVPKLDEDDSVPSAFDMSRSMTLNPQNPFVQRLHAFIGLSLDEVRRSLVAEDKERKRSEEAKRLDRQATEIERMLNSDFDDYRRRLARVKAMAGSGADFQPSGLTNEPGDDLLVPGEDLSVDEVYPPRTEHQISVPGAPPELVEAPDGEKRANPVKAGDGSKARPKGGFGVEFGNLGTDSPRAKYRAEDRTILINLEHPQISAARGAGSIEDPVFRRLAYEVAFTEYAIALAYELALRGEFMDFDEPVGEIRDTVNRLAVKSAELYLE